MACTIFLTNIGIPVSIGVRANIHLGGAGRVLSFARMDSVGGGGGGSSRNFPGSIFCGLAEFFPLTPVTNPQFVFFYSNMYCVLPE